MDATVLLYTVPQEELDIPEKEILRYLGYQVRGITEDDLAMVRSFLPGVRSVFSPKACYARFPVALLGEGWIELPYGKVQSFDLSRNLAGCRGIYMFAATVGLAFDRLLHRTYLRSMADAAMLQAVGAAAAEAFVDRLNDDLKMRAAAEGFSLKPRYSPGFGDFGLENQRGFFRVLEPPRHIGLSLKENCIMAPEKSVTALIGIQGGQA